MDFTLQKMTAHYLVKDAASKRHLGEVRRVEDWTAHGTRVRWEAHRMGRHLGSMDTRKDAAALLTL